MTDDRKLAGFHQWSLAVLDLLSATADRQVAYLRGSAVGADELLLQFDDVLHVARARAADGSLAHEDLQLLLEVGDKVERVNAGPDSIWSEDALSAAVEWEDLRVTAGGARTTLEGSWTLGPAD
ncbi:hypothetical protein ACIQ6V_30550 [Streptomyces sp. NPDC096198]|uniref:hypothetical protein n=1 Tax=Streptomyces sp. NPDC096198 TaxID=3366080 RepID=UPI0038146765